MNNIIDIQTKLAQRHNYIPLSKADSDFYRKMFTEFIPSYLFINGDNHYLKTLSGTPFANGYKRIVIGDYGAFIEMTPDNILQEELKCQEGQEYRYEEKYKNVKYYWLTVKDDSNIKIYFQKRKVPYADYQRGMYYVSVYEVML